MKLVNNVLYFTMQDLERAGLLEETIKKGCLRNRKGWESIKDPDDHRVLLIAYEPLVAKYKQKVLAAFGDPYEVLRLQTEGAQLATTQLLADAVKVNQDHYRDLAKRLTKDLAAQCARAAGWLQLLGDVRGKRDAEKLGFESKEAVLKAALENIEAEALRPLRVKNVQVLRRWIRRYHDEGYVCVIPSTVGNKNAAKLEDDQIRYLMALMGDPHKPPVTTVTYVYNKDAAERGWPQITHVTARNYLYMPENRRVWEMMRHGEQSWYNEYDVTIRRQAPSAPNAMWVLDGTPLDLYYQKRVRRYNEHTGKWEERTSYYNRLYAFIVVDAHSWKFVGVALGHSETAALVSRALKNAVQSEMSLPRQFQYDHGSGIGAQEWLMKSLDVYGTATRPYNPKGKIIEACIGHFQSMVLRYFDNWAGGNITAKTKDSRFNPDFLKENRDSFPTEEQVHKQFEQAVNAWNALATKDREAPMDKHRQTAQVGKSVDIFDLVNMFWQKRRKTYLYRQDGITLEIDNKAHNYLVPSAEFYKKHIRDRFQVVYDPECLDFIYLYQNDKPVLDKAGEPVIAQAAELVPMALHDHHEGSRTNLNRLLKLKDQVKQDTVEEVAAIRRYADEENIKLGARLVFKEHLNGAETRFKASLLDDDDCDLGSLLENQYLD